MKTLKAFLAVGLFVFGLGFTSCSSDDKFIDPNAPTPEHPIYHPEKENPIMPETVPPLP